MCLWLYSRLQIWNFLYLLSFACLAVIINKIINLLSPQAVELIDLSSCPACYGTSACDQIDNLIIHPINFYSILSHLFNKKNVFYGTMNESKVVIKKLAHEEELNEFDEMLCENTKFINLCHSHNNDNSEKKQINTDNEINFFLEIQNAVSPNFLVNNGSGLVLCPSASYLENVMKELFVYDINYIHLWTLIKINPEPIILQILRADEGWPVAKYYGACGRIVVEEYVGPPLAVYYNEPWYRRARIAINLLKAAHMFTYRNPNFSFYLTDLSADNIAVDQNDKPKLVDLENIIILNRDISDKEKPKNWHKVHVSDNILSCEDCFSFSPIDICDHHVSDHNYYAICESILAFKSDKNQYSRGLLHSIPEYVTNIYPELKVLINECVLPVTEHSRIDAGDKLKRILEEIIKNDE